MCVLVLGLESVADVVDLEGLGLGGSSGVLRGGLGWWVRAGGLGDVYVYVCVFVCVFVNLSVYLFLCMYLCRPVPADSNNGPRSCLCIRATCSIYRNEVLGLSVRSAHLSSNSYNKPATVAKLILQDKKYTRIFPILTRLTCHQ